MPKQLRQFQVIKYPITLGFVQNIFDRAGYLIFLISLRLSQRSINTCLIHPHDSENLQGRPELVICIYAWCLEVEN